jgi:hypothetical protein
MSVFAMLTSVGTGLEQYYPYLPLAVAVFCAVILLIAFCIGAKKGARRVSWGGFVWLFAAGAFIALDKVVFAEGNPLTSAFAGVAELFIVMYPIVYSLFCHFAFVGNFCLI